MTETRFERYAPLAGVGYFVLGIIGSGLAEPDPGFAPTSDKVVAYFTAHKDAVMASRTVYLVSMVLLLWFVSSLRSRLRQAEGGQGRLAELAFAGGIAGFTLSIASAAVAMIGALRIDQVHAIDPQVATVLWDLSAILFSLAAPTAFAALVLPSAALSLRTGVLPRWLGAISVALGAALLLPPISHVAIILFTFWVAVVATALVVRVDPQSSSPAVAVASFAGASPCATLHLGGGRVVTDAPVDDSRQWPQT